MNLILIAFAIVCEVFAAWKGDSRVAYAGLAFYFLYLIVR